MLCAKRKVGGPTADGTSSRDNLSRKRSENTESFYDGDNAAVVTDLHRFGMTY